MVYLEHCLRRAKISAVTTARLCVTPGEDWVGRDLRDELRDL